MGWLGTALIFLGHWQLGSKRRAAFILTMCGGVLWLAEGIRILKPDLVLVELVMLFVQFRNWVRWGRSIKTDD